MTSRNKPDNTHQQHSAITEAVLRFRQKLAGFIDTADFKSLNLLQKFRLRVHGMQVAYTPNADACRACGLCVTACPEKAITLGRKN